MPSNPSFFRALSDFISVGRIGRAHGTEGWVRSVSYSSPGRFDGVRVVYFEIGGSFEGKIIENIEKLPESVLLKFKYVDDREDAKALVGKEIFLPDDQKIELEEDAYFLHDLVGLEVVDEEDNHIGILEEILEMGGNDVYVVRKEEKEILVPAVSEFIRNIDLKSGRVTVRLWEEM